MALGVPPTKDLAQVQAELPVLEVVELTEEMEDTDLPTTTATKPTAKPGVLRATSGAEKLATKAQAVEVACATASLAAQAVESSG